LWPWSEIGIASDEAGAALWVGWLAAVIALWGVISQRAITRRQLTIQLMAQAEADRDLIAARTRFTRITQNPAYLVGLAEAEKPAEGSGDKSEAPKTLERDEDAQAIRLIFNHYELVAIGIQRGIIDFELYKRFTESIVLRDWERAAPLIYQLRRTYSQPTMYHEVEELVRWFKGDNGLPRRRRFSLWR
jgi:Domain of unknown function (DUF4760)